MPVDILTTSRLVLRSTRDSDLNSLHATVFSDTAVMQQAFAGKPLSRKESEAFYTNSFDHDGNGWQIGVLTLKNSRTPIGFAGLLSCAALGKPDYEIGFVLGRQFWGKGYATEIGRAQIDYGLGELGCERLLALVAPGNEASRAVLRKIGMIHHSAIETVSRGIRDIYVATP